MDTEVKNKKTSFAPGIKLLLLGVIALALLIPQVFIDLLVDSRKDTAEEVREELARSWGGEQYVRPLWLAFHKLDKQGKATDEMVYIQADSVRMNVEVTTNERTRGFYSAILYHATLHVSGYFNPALLKGKEGEDISVNPDGYLCTGIREPMGLKSNFVVKMGGKDYALQVSSIPQPFVNTCLAAPFNGEKDSAGYFSYTYELNGYKNLEFYVQTPATDVSLTMHYPNPAFSGDCLPDERTITDSVTTARWKLYASTSLFPQVMVKERSDRYYDYDEDKERSFIVSTQFTDVYYRAIERSLKYAILIIVFTFLTFFFTDTLSKTNMPMIGYLLTGVAILLFYTLLLSLSEYLPFGWAYFLSSVAIISMIGIYFWSFIRSLKATGVCVGILVLLYLFLYIILQMDAFPLLVGSLFLFVVLGVVMYLSRKLTW